MLWGPPEVNAREHGSCASNLGPLVKYHILIYAPPLLNRILERLPVIVEDFTDWQRDFWDLQTEQAQYGIKFPAEMGFKYSDEKPPTMEEIMEQSPVPLAPRR